MTINKTKYHYIYKTTNIITGRYYYGMHSTFNLDDGYLGSGKRLRYSINKYGEKNSNFGKMWITDGIVCKTMKKEELIPKGWYKGRVNNWNKQNK